MRCSKSVASTAAICERDCALRANAYQPPFFARLPGFFLLRVAVPRSRLRFWPRPTVAVEPATGMGLGARMSLSVLIFLAMDDSSK